MLHVLSLSLSLLPTLGQCHGKLVLLSILGLRALRATKKQLACFFERDLFAANNPGCWVCSNQLVSGTEREWPAGHGGREHDQPDTGTESTCPVGHRGGVWLAGCRERDWENMTSWSQRERVRDRLVTGTERVTSWSRRERARDQPVTGTESVTGWSQARERDLLQRVWPAGHGGRECVTSWSQGQRAWPAGHRQESVTCEIC